MTWHLTDYAKTRTPIPGVPWRDLSDEEFAQLDVDGVFEARGYWTRAEETVIEEPSPPPKARRKR